MPARGDMATKAFGRGSPLRDPQLLGLLAALQGTLVVMLLVALAVRPLPPQDSLAIANLGPQGNRRHVNPLEHAVCAIDIGVGLQGMERLEAEVVGEVEAWIVEQVLDLDTRTRLLGLGEILVNRYDFARLYHDMALLPPATCRVMLANERARGVEAAGAFLPSEAALRFERALYESWDGHWQALEAELAPLQGQPSFSDLGPTAPSAPSAP